MRERVGLRLKSLIVVIAALAALLLGAFFGFVGWSKATAPLAELARHHAWTIYLPEWLGRLVGISEVILALGLLAMLVPARRAVARWSTLLLIANQVCAGAVHAWQGEFAALPQNAVLIGLLVLVAGAARPQNYKRENA